MPVSNMLITHIESLIQAAYNEGYRSAEARIQLRGHDPLGRTTWIGSLASNGLPELRRALEAAEAAREADHIADVRNMVPQDSARQPDALPAPAGTVPGRLPLAMTTLSGISGVMEPCVLVAFDDGTWWTIGAENWQWNQVPGPEVAATVEKPDA